MYYDKNTLTLFTISFESLFSEIFSYFYTYLCAKYFIVIYKIFELYDFQFSIIVCFNIMTGAVGLSFNLCYIYNVTIFDIYSL